MQLKIKKTTQEEIFIETPKYYQTYATIIKLCEKGLTKVGDDMMFHYPVTQSDYFINEVMELLQSGKEVEEQVFIDKLETAIVTIKNIVYEK
jgi:predicted phosphohydrolase